MLNNLSLSNVLNKEFLQRFQEDFADCHQAACLIIDSESNFITKTINKTNFCAKVRKTRNGFENCEYCQKEALKEAIEKKEVIEFSCKTGMTSFVSPIFFDEIYLGSIICGQMFFKKPDNAEIKAMSEYFGIDENAIKDEIKKVAIKPQNEKKSIKNTLMIMSNTVARIAHGKYLLKFEIEKETFLNELAKKVIETKEIQEVLDFTCEGLTKLLDVQRVVIFRFQKPFPVMLKDYRPKPELINEISEFLTKEQYIELIKYWEHKLTVHKEPVFFNDLETANVSDEIKDIYRKSNITSAITTVIRETEDYCSVLVLGTYGKDRTWTNEEKKFLETIAKQIKFFYTQFDLKKQLVHRAKRENTLLNTLPMCVWLKNKNGEYIFVNEVYLSGEELTEDEVIGKTDFDIYSKNLALERRQEDLKVIENRQTIKIQKFTQIGINSVWVETIKTPIFDENGEIFAVAGIMRDITEQHEMDRLKSEFVSMVSHELRTPLTSIIGGLELALKGFGGELPKKANDLLDIANSNASRLLKLINDILDVEKLEAGKMDFNFEYHNLDDVVNEAIKEIIPFAEKYNIEITSKDILKNVTVNIDKIRLIQVITNLLSNAIKFAIQNTKVNVTIKRVAKNKVQIGVTNFGSEIPKEYSSEIFQKFSQLDSSDKRKKGGTGLGLSISKMIIEKMGGTIYFVSADNRTTFYVTLNEIE